MKFFKQNITLTDEEQLKCVTREKDLTSLGYQCLKQLVDYGFKGKDIDNLYKYERYWVWTNQSQFIITYDIGNTHCYVDIILSKKFQTKLQKIA